MTLDRFTPINSRYIDIGVGGPNGFTFTATVNVTWLRLSPAQGTISTSKTEQRVLATVDWDAAPEGSSAAAIIIVANAKGQAEQRTTVGFVAINSLPEAGFKGFVEGDGAVSIEAAHAQRNTTVDGVSWREIVGYGKTLSGVTPLPHLGHNGQPFEIGQGPVL